MYLDRSFVHVTLLTLVISIVLSGCLAPKPLNSRAGGDGANPGQSWDADASWDSAVWGP